MIANSLASRTSRRRGFGLIEMAVAGALFLAMVLITIQLIGWVATERQAVNRREVATRALGNLIEQILARPWTEISTESITSVAASMNGSRSTGRGQIRAQVIDGPAVDGRGSKKVVAELVWPDHDKRVGASVRLVAWTFERKGTTP